ncbi:MAG: lytic transglycosylase domain-containing protein [Burkholderiaceae bacterium]|nr:lytic transglycosylase domain-containing protein [Burkholderiaceae bacterium]
MGSRLLTSAPRRLPFLHLLLVLLACASATAPLRAEVPAPSPDDSLVLQAREAVRAKDGAKLDLLRDQLIERRHPLAPWADYWSIGLRLKTATQADLEAFYARWPGTYVEDRLRNDWLLELGERRDWDNFRREQPRFQMADDLEVDCYTLLLRHQAGENVRAAAADVWMRQKRDDDGCNLMARTMAADGRLGPAEIWPKIQQAVERGRTKEARADAALLDKTSEARVRALLDNPARWLTQQPAARGDGARDEAVVLALLRMAASDADAAATQATDWSRRLPPALAARAWAGIGYRAAMRQQAAARQHYERAFALVKGDGAIDWPEEHLVWAARAALRADGNPDWALLQRSIAAMPDALQASPDWHYWAARALQARARPGEMGNAQRAHAERMLRTLASDPGDFYGLLALEDLGLRLALPPRPPAPTAEERAAVRGVPGLQRALQLLSLGLRSEGVREWNFTLRELRQRADADRALLTAAAWACEREVWDRCINTSERTQGVVDVAQRFPTPLRDEVVEKSKAAGLETAYIYGLIRQESRFIMDARSVVGASGLMQLMPATARWTARKIGLDYKPSMITDPHVNLQLGTAYLKLLLDDFEGAQPLAIAGYNAGPNRPRRWREGGTLETAAWVENIPFNETRDYVKKVLTNAVHYAHVLGEGGTSLKARLGPTVGPRRTDAPATDKELP